MLQSRGAAAVSRGRDELGTLHRDVRGAEAGDPARARHPRGPREAPGWDGLREGGLCLASGTALAALGSVSQLLPLSLPGCLRENPSLAGSLGHTSAFASCQKCFLELAWSSWLKCTFSSPRTGLGHGRTR